MALSPVLVMLIFVMAIELFLGAGLFLVVLVGVDGLLLILKNWTPLPFLFCFVMLFIYGKHRHENWQPQPFILWLFTLIRRSL